jgi:hypothetical protein
MARWDCGRVYIYELINKGMLTLWHPDGEQHSKGIRILVVSILELEEKGIIRGP